MTDMKSASGENEMAAYGIITAGLKKKGRSKTYSVNTIGTLMVKRPACVCDGEDDDDDDGDDGDDLFLLVFCCW